MKPEEPKMFVKRLSRMLGGDVGDKVRVLSRPEDMTDEQCLPLSVISTVDSDGVRHTVSCWRATFRERIRFLLCGELWLGVCAGGVTQPPTFLVVGARKIFGKTNEE